MDKEFTAFLLMFLLFFVVGVALYVWVATSDMPTWAKVLLLK